MQVETIIKKDIHIIASFLIMVSTWNIYIYIIPSFLNCVFYICMDDNENIRQHCKVSDSNIVQNFVAIHRKKKLKDATQTQTCELTLNSTVCSPQSHEPSPNDINERGPSPR